MLWVEMETLKKPEMIFTIGNTCGLIALCTYVYNESKKYHALNADITKALTLVETRLNNVPTPKNVADIQALIQNQVKKWETRNRISTAEFSRLTNLVESLQDQIEEISKVLNTAEIKVDLTKFTQQRTKKAQPRRQRQVRYREEEDDEDDEVDDDEMEEEEYQPRRRQGRNSPSSSAYGDDIPRRRAN